MNDEDVNFSRLFKNTQLRNARIHRAVGTLASHFAELEIAIIQLLAFLINSARPRKTLKVLSQLSYRQSVDALQSTLKDNYPLVYKQELSNRLFEQLVSAGSDRNDVVHSSWFSISSTAYSQTRPRVKAKHQQEQETHWKSPIKKIEQARDRIETLVGHVVFLHAEIEELANKAVEGTAPR